MAQPSVHFKLPEGDNASVERPSRMLRKSKSVSLPLRNLEHSGSFSPRNYTRRQRSDILESGEISPLLSASSLRESTMKYRPPALVYLGLDIDDNGYAIAVSDGNWIIANFAEYVEEEEEAHYNRGFATDSRSEPAPAKETAANMVARTSSDGEAEKIAVRTDDKTILSVNDKSIDGSTLEDAMTSMTNLNTSMSQKQVQQQLQAAEELQGDRLEGPMRDRLSQWEDDIITWLKAYSLKRNLKFIAAGVQLQWCNSEWCISTRSSCSNRTSGGKDKQDEEEDSDEEITPKSFPSSACTSKTRIFSRLWLELDIVPVLVFGRGQTREERAPKLAMKVVKHINPNNLFRVSISQQQRVLDSEFIKLVELEDYQAFCPKPQWTLFTNLVDKFRSRGLKMYFFNATAQGGGVAIMRHAQMRLAKLCGIDMKWFVVKPKHEVFLVTKRKLHNVLQGVAPEDQPRLDEEDRACFAEWSEHNAMLFRNVIEDANVIVLDDPQVSGLMKYIKQWNPNCKVVFRSHIQLRSDLIDEQGTPQNEAFRFIWEENEVKNCDVFFSHPIPAFVPKMVPNEKVVMWGAVTDPLDGLNKRLSEHQMRFYVYHFNQILLQQGQEPLDVNRPYLIQVARFDPSKGLIDVVKAYGLLRKKLQARETDEQQIDPDDLTRLIDEKGSVQRTMFREIMARLEEKERRRQSNIPQLVLVGHGSIDDPDGNPIVSEVMNFLAQPECAAFKQDVKVCRLPPSDQMLDCLMRGSFCALQLSIREGFEIKVTEAIHKGVPVIAYRAGGIPLQIENGQNGFLVDVGDVEAVADILLRLHTDKALYAKVQQTAMATLNYDLFTVMNCAVWLFVALELLLNGGVKGDFRYVKDLIAESSYDEEKYCRIKEHKEFKAGSLN